MQGGVIFSKETSYIFLSRVENFLDIFNDQYSNIIYFLDKH